MKICVVMYADDLLLMAEIKEEINDLLAIADKYGKDHGMRFNPDKTELLIFNHNVKRTAEAKRKDDARRSQ